MAPQCECFAVTLFRAFCLIPQEKEPFRPFFRLPFRFRFFSVLTQKRKTGKQNGKARRASGHVCGGSASLCTLPPGDSNQGGGCEGAGGVEARRNPSFRLLGFSRQARSFSATLLNRGKSARPHFPALSGSDLSRDLGPLLRRSEVWVFFCATPPRYVGVLGFGLPGAGGDERPVPAEFPRCCPRLRRRPRVKLPGLSRTWPGDGESATSGEGHQGIAGSLGIGRELYGAASTRKDARFK